MSAEKTQLPYLYAHGTLPDMAVIKTPEASAFGLGIKRQEMSDLNLNNFWQTIAHQALKMKEIPVNNGHFILVVTLNPSPHTPFFVDVDFFCKAATKIWGIEEKAIQQVLTDGYHITNWSEARIPLHLITWLIYKDEQNQPQLIDAYDLTSLTQRYDRKNASSVLTSFSPEEQTQFLAQFSETLFDILTKNNQLLLSLYEKVTDQITQFFSSDFNWADVSLDEETKNQVREAVAQVLTEPGYPDHAMCVGYYEHKETKMGRGPQSVPLWHLHSVIYAHPAKIEERVRQILPNLANDQLRKVLTAIFNNLNRAITPGQIELSIIRKKIYDQANQLANISTNQSIKNYTEQVFKQEDPYASLFFEAGLPIWQKLVAQSFGWPIEAFTHQQSKLLTLFRSAEGFSLTLPYENFLVFWQGFNQLLTKLYQLWQNILAHPHADQNTIKSLIANSLALTESDLNAEEVRKALDRLSHLIRILQNPPRWLAEKSSSSLRTDFIHQYGPSTGYNIPGVPGLGLTFELKDNQIEVTFGPLLSKKGVAEQASGAALIRSQGKT